MKCSVEGCQREATFRVYLYDSYPNVPTVFMETDYTCPYLCDQHFHENETKADGIREPRGYIKYPYTNKGLAQGFSIYKELKER